MHAKLYTQQDNDRLQDLMAQMHTIEQAHPWLAQMHTIEQAHPWLVQTPPSSSKDIQSSNFQPKLLKCPAFTVRTSKAGKFNIDASAFKPSQATLLKGKQFEQAYTAQLSSILYHNSDEPPMGELTELMYTYDRIQRHGTLKLSSGLFVRRLPQIVSVLNSFFVKNAVVIDTICTMIAGRITQPATTTEVKV